MAVDNINDNVNLGFFYHPPVRSNWVVTIRVSVIDTEMSQFSIIFFGSTAHF